jgi:hypothetical protein
MKAIFVEIKQRYSEAEIWVVMLTVLFFGSALLKGVIVWLTK